MESKSEKWQLKRIGTMSFINDECDNMKQSDKSFFENIIRNIFIEVIADFKELEGTIENNVTEISEFFNDGVEIFECNSCGMLMEENEPYNNYCPNCGRKIKK